MQIVILCGGLATRLRPLTKKIPKSMIPIWGKPFLEYQLELIKRNGIFDVILCIGYRGEQIKKYFGDGSKFGMRIKYSSDGKKLLGTGGALKKAEPLLKEVFMTMWGDSYLPFDFQEAIKFFQKNKKLGLMTVYRNENRIEPSNVEVKGNLVVAYSKKRKTKKMKYIDYGASIFKKEVLKYIPKNQFYDLAKLNQLLIRKRQLLAFPVKQRYYQIGTFEGLEEFQNFIKKSLSLVKPQGNKK